MSVDQSQNPPNPAEPGAGLGGEMRAQASGGTISPPLPAPAAGYGPVFDVRSSPSPAMSAVLRENWWAVAARGVAAILFGLFALLAPGPTLLSLALIFALYMLVDGILGIVAAIRAAQKHERWVFFVLEGIVDIAAGLAALVWPAAAVVAFVLLMGVWALLTGGLMFAAALKLEKDHGRIWLVLGAFASIMLGVMLIVAPMIGALVFTWWVGAYALAFGGILIALAFKLKARREAAAPIAA